MPTAASLPLMKYAIVSAGEQSGGGEGPRTIRAERGGERLARRAGGETGLGGGAVVLSEAEGDFSAVTKETEKNSLERSGTKASLQRPGCGAT